ncbi:MAG: hypothetical protein ACK47M_10105, partial [Caldilinea sp.]
GAYARIVGAFGETLNSAIPIRIVMEDSHDKQSSDQTADNAVSAPTILHTLIAIDARNLRITAEALFARI